MDKFVPEYSGILFHRDGNPLAIPHSKDVIDPHVVIEWPFHACTLPVYFRGQQDIRSHCGWAELACTEDDSIRYGIQLNTSNFKRENLERLKPSFGGVIRKRKEHTILGVKITHLSLDILHVDSRIQPLQMTWLGPQYKVSAIHEPAKCECGAHSIKSDSHAEYCPLAGSVTIEVPEA